MSHGWVGEVSPFEFGFSGWEMITRDEIGWKAVTT